MKNVQAAQLANFMRAIYLFQAHSTETDVSHWTESNTTDTMDQKSDQTYQTNCPSTASESPRFPFVVAHHFSSVQIGATASKLRKRSSGSFFERRNDCRSRRLMTIVRLGDTISTLLHVIRMNGMYQKTKKQKKLPKKKAVSALK
jgi:hypothetical protein